jgi:hypothetical protein
MGLSGKLTAMAGSADAPRELLDYLLAQLADDPGGHPNYAPAQLHQANGVLWVCARASLFDEDEVVAWRERLHQEGVRFGKIANDKIQRSEIASPIRPRPEIPPGVEDLLERQLLAIDRRRQGSTMVGRRLSPFSNEERSAAHVLLDGLLQLGLITDEDAAGWRGRFERAADPDAEPLRSYSVDALASLTAEAEKCDAERVRMLTGPLVHPLPWCSFEHLVEVMRVQLAGEVDSRIEFLEFYDDGFAVTWTSESDPAWDPSKPAQAPRAWRRIEAADDLGTFYFPSGGGGGGSGGRTRRTWRHIFAPAVPHHAIELRLTIGDEAFAIRLPREQRTPAATPER